MIVTTWSERLSSISVSQRSQQMMVFFIDEDPSIGAGQQSVACFLPEPASEGNGGSVADLVMIATSSPTPREAVPPAVPDRLNAHTSLRSTHEEKAAWEADAERLGIGLSEYLRLIANNASGHHSPNDLRLWSDEDLADFVTNLVAEQEVRKKGARQARRSRLRGRLTQPPELGIAAGLAMCQCCLHGHHLMQSLPL